MGIIRRTISVCLIGGTAATGAFVFSTRNSNFVSISATDPIFRSAAYAKYNPDRNPATQDLCVKQVPLAHIKPALLEQRGRLVEAFCAGVWGGLGYTFQRAYLARKYENASTAHQLWSRPALQTSAYPVGTQITDHFEVVSHTDNAIVVRCGDSPLKKDVRPSDGLFEMSVEVDEARGVARFGLKSVFYQGLGRAQGPPMPGWMEFLHRWYTKLWMETAVDTILA